MSLKNNTLVARALKEWKVRSPQRVSISTENSLAAAKSSEDIGDKQAAHTEDAQAAHARATPAPDTGGTLTGTNLGHAEGEHDAASSDDAKKRKRVDSEEGLSNAAFDGSGENRDAGDTGNGEKGSAPSAPPSDPGML